jgi:hypothetical protein
MTDQKKWRAECELKGKSDTLGDSRGRTGRDERHDAPPFDAW